MTSRPLIAALLVALSMPLTAASAEPAAETARNATVDPADANWQIDLVGLFGEGVDRKTKKPTPKDLHLSLNVRGGEIVAGVGRSPLFNKAGHRVDASTLKIDGDGFAGELQITVYPDRWVPGDGKPIPVTAEVRGEFERTDDGLKLTGRYDARLGEADLAGKLAGRVTARPSAEDMTLYGRLFPTRIDDRDFPEMELSLVVSDGKVTLGRFGMTWNRWSHRWHAIDASALAWDPVAQSLTGAVEVPARAVDAAAPAGSRYRLVFDGAAVGGMFVTRITATPLGSADLPERQFNGGAPIGEGYDVDDEAYDPDAFEWFYAVDDDPWSVPVKGHDPVEPGEHPRLLFRKSEVEQMRRRAETPEGRLIVKRLRRLLGNDGESLPTTFNTTAPHNHNKSPAGQPLGTFTSFHAPGYAMLYQLTGEQKYADLARGAVELMFAGKMDRDNRYGWKTPGTHLRVGSILASVALTYDLAYDGWTPAYRQKVARSLQDYNQEVASGGEASVRELMGRTGYPPASNHYGSHFGGTLLAMLAIKGDPGVDDAFVDARIEEGPWMLPHRCSFGRGEGGWYQEGPHPSRLTTNGGFVMAVQGIRNVLGLDYISPRPNAQWATLRWVMWSVPSSRGPVFVNRGTYGDDTMYGRAPMYSHSGDFVYGFGAVEDKYKPAVLWTYLNTVEKPWAQGPNRPGWLDEGERSFNAMVYPMHAVFALANWPIGVEPQNPAEVMPTHHVDTVNDFFVSRNTWEDGKDIVVTFSTGGGPWGYHRPAHRGSMIALAFGSKYTLPSRLGHHRPTHHAAADDGSFTLATRPNWGWGSEGAVAADLSGKSGAALVMIHWTPAAEDKLRQSVDKAIERMDREVAAEKRRREQGKPARDLPESQIEMLGHGEGAFVVVTVDPETQPQIALDGDTLTVGKQAYTLDDGVIDFNGLGKR